MSSISSGLQNTLEFDVLIKNGNVFDGTESPPRLLDIGVKGETIVAMGSLVGPAKTTIQAEGLIVTPGFIDVHTHTDLIDLNSLADSSLVEEYNNLFQGVTTVISGLCGVGASHIDDWFDCLKKARFSTNVYHLIPHGALRAELFHEHLAVLDEKQMTLMKERIAEEMEKGAIGISTGLIYTPGSHADTEELIECCKVIQQYGGLYVSHVRGEDGESVLKAYREAIEIGREAGVPVHISHMKLLKPYKDVAPEEMLSILEDARRDGLDVTGDQYPYAACATFLSGLLPIQYQDPVGIKQEYKSGRGKEKLRDASRMFLSEVSPHEILIVNNPGDPGMNGKYLHEIAASQNISSIEAFLRILSTYDDVFTAFFILNEEAMKQIMKKEYVFTGSDGLSPLRAMNAVKKRDHPRAYGAFAKKIRTYALDEEVITLKQAIMSMTSRPAKKFNMRGRGELKVGNYADIAVIDLRAYRDRATFEHADRYAQGVKYVLVNGVVELADEKITSKKGGLTVWR